MTRVLITGAGGFAGGHLTEACLAGGDQVVGLSRSAEERVADGAHAVAVDLTDARATLAAVRDATPEVVYHLAAQASVPSAWREPGPTLSGNLQITLSLLEAIREAAPRARLVMVGSGEVYGPPESLPVAEDAALRPQNPYAVSKAAADLLAGMYADAHDLDVLRVRAFNHAGPRQSPEYVVSTLARQAAAGLRNAAPRLRVVTGNLESQRDFTDVRDVVRAYRALAAAAPGGAYNVCSGDSTSVADLIGVLEAVTGREVEPEVDPALVRSGEVMEVRGDPARLHAATGWSPQIALERTVADTVEWWRQELG